MSNENAAFKNSHTVEQYNIAMETLKYLRHVRPYQLKDFYKIVDDALVRINQIQLQIEMERASE